MQLSQTDNQLGPTEDLLLRRPSAECCESLLALTVYTQTCTPAKSLPVPPTPLLLEASRINCSELFSATEPLAHYCWQNIGLPLSKASEDNMPRLITILQGIPFIFQDYNIGFGRTRFFRHTLKFIFFQPGPGWKKVVLYPEPSTTILLKCGHFP